MAFKSFYRRRFLNRRGHHAGAYVLAECTLETYRKQVSVDATLTVADCGRVATLDFTAHDAAGRRNAVHKAQVLREVVNDFAAALERAYEEREERVARRENS